MNKFYITTPIYYVNSRPHIGHAYTTVVADILARYYRFKYGADNVWFLTGTDEHGTKIAQAAEKEGKEPIKFCDEISAQYRETWKNLGISNDDFIRTTEERHEKVVVNILNKLKEAKTLKGNDALYKSVYEGLYCVGCEAYKREADLIDRKCPDHGKEPEFLREENWYFRLSDFSDDLRERIVRDKIKILPEERKKEVLSFLGQGLEDIAISREQVKWGIPVPFDKDQTIYVWIDALINYVSALGYPKDKKFKKFWPADLHLIGKDILKFHCVIWPAILIVAGIEPPAGIFVHGYFTINDQKMSKTLGNVIDPNELVKEFGAEAARYLIVSQFPCGQDGDVKAEEFKVKYNADLANGLGNLVSRVFGMVEKYCDNVVPDKKYSSVPVDLKKIWQEIDELYAQYKIFEANKLVWHVIGAADNYVAENKPWELAKLEKREELAQILYNLLEIIRHLAYFVLPVLPAISNQILAQLNESAADYKKAQKISGLKPGQRIKKAEPLFLRQ